MLKHLLLAASAVSIFSFADAQQTATFEDLSLGTDTFYLDLDTNGYSFETGGSVTLYGKFTQESWGIGGEGFTYSNRVDTAQCSSCFDLDFQMANRPGGGANNSEHYGIAFAYQPASLKYSGSVPLSSGVQFLSAMISNTTWGYSYANATYNETNEGWAKLTVKGYMSSDGAQVGGPVDLFLADFRSGTPAAQQGILNDWITLDLSPIAGADSLTFVVTSSDDFFPAYFAIDDIVTELTTSIAATSKLNAGIFPNPTSGMLTVKYTEPLNIGVVDMLGKRILSLDNTNTVDMSGLAAGQYLLHITTLDGTKRSVMKVSKL